MKTFNPNKKIESADYYTDYANDLFEAFLMTFNRENGLIRDITEDDSADPEEISFLYTDKGMRLAEKMKRLLREVGEAHFPNEDIEIESSCYQEY